MAVHSILPNTNVSFNDIRDTLNANGGSVTNDAITAFQSRANMNVYSKSRPGYWHADNKQVAFRLPRGMGYNDPRGAYLGMTVEGYHWGAFRGYYTGAIAPSFTPTGVKEIEIEWDGPTLYTASIMYNLGEVDWFADDRFTDTDFHSWNDIKSGSDFIVCDTEDNILYSKKRTDLTRSGRNRVDNNISLSLGVPGGYNTSKTYNIRAAVGDAATKHVYAYLPDTSLSFVIRRKGMNMLTYRCNYEDYKTLWDQMMGLQSSDSGSSISRVLFSPAGIEILADTSVINITTDKKFRMDIYLNNGSVYDIAEMRWNPSGIVMQGGSNVATWSASLQNMGDGLYTGSISFSKTLPRGSYYLDFNEFGYPSVSKK